MVKSYKKCYYTFCPVGKTTKGECHELETETGLVDGHRLGGVLPDQAAGTGCRRRRRCFQRRGRRLRKRHHLPDRAVHLNEDVPMNVKQSQGHSVTAKRGRVSFYSRTPFTEKAAASDNLAGPRAPELSTCCGSNHF